MALLVIVVTGALAHVFIFPMRWLVAATIISSLDLGCVDSSSRGGALRPGSAGSGIATISIMPTLVMVSARSSQALSSLGTMRRHGLCLLEAEQKGASVPGMILGRVRGGAVAWGAVGIHFTESQRKVQGGLDFSRDSFLDGLVPGVFLTTFLLDLGTDRGPEAIAE